MVRIGDICDVLDGPHATPKKTDSGPVYLGIKALTADGRIDATQYAFLSESDYIKWTRRVTPQYGDMVFSYEATLGRYALVPENFRGALGRRLAVIRPKTNAVNIKWLYYYFLSPEWQAVIADNTVKGSTVNRISIDDFPNLEVPLPSRSNQDALVSVLQPIDKAISLNCQLNDNLSAAA